MKNWEALVDDREESLLGAIFEQLFSELFTTVSSNNGFAFSKEDLMEKIDETLDHGDKENFFLYASIYKKLYGNEKVEA